MCAFSSKDRRKNPICSSSSIRYLHVVGCSLWEAKLLVVFWKRLKTQYCFVLLKESLRHHSPHNCMFFVSYTIWQKIFVESVHILLNLLIWHCCAVLFIQLKNYINNLLTYMWLWKCPSIYGVLGKLENIYTYTTFDILFCKIYQLKALEPKNKDQTNFYECCDLKKSISNTTCK